MASKSHLRPLSLIVGLLVISVIPLSSLPVVRACINPPETCTAPDFELSMEAPDAIVYQGSQPVAQIFIYGRSNAYYTGNVNLSLAITPNVVSGPQMSLDHPTLYFIPAVFRDSGVFITAGLNTPLGNYTVTVTGTDGSLTRTTSFVLVVAPPIPPDDFTVGLYPIPTQIQPGGHSDVTIQVFRNGPSHAVPIDFTVELALTITPPNGLVATAFPGSAYIGAYDGIGMTFVVQSSSTTTPGAYTLNATGTNYQRSQSLSHSTVVTITVANPPTSQPPPNPSSGSSSPRSNSHQNSSSSINAPRLIQLLSVLTARINRPIFWSVVTGVVVGAILSLTAVLIALKRNRRQSQDPSNRN